MSEGLILFRQPEPFPSFTIDQLMDYLTARGVTAMSNEGLVAQFDVLCHVDGVLYYRRDLDVPAQFKYSMRDPANVFASGAAYPCVNVMLTHDENGSTNVLERSHGISFEEFRTINLPKLLQRELQRK